MALILANESAGGDIYKLPTELQAKVQEQYDRDVARVRCAGRGGWLGGMHGARVARAWRTHGRHALPYPVPRHIPEPPP